MSKDGGRKTITFFLPSLEPGGTEKNVVNLVNNINREKYEIKLLLGLAEGDFLDQVHKDIPIINMEASWSLPIFLKLIKYFRKEKPDVFVSAFPRINVIVILSKIFSGARAKIIITEHALFSFLPVMAKSPGRKLFARFLMPFVAKIIYPKADKIVCVSNGIAEDILKIVNCPGKISTIYNPVVNDEILELSEESLEDMDFSSESMPVILSVGRLVKCKDYPTLLRAFSIILQKMQARLVILGRGPKEQNLKQLAESLGISDSVIFLGFKKNPFKYMKRASVFVLSSVQEGFGNVLIEAMACGVPVVSTDCPMGPGEIIKNGENGILVPVGNPELMAEGILKILNDADLSRKLSLGGKKRAGDFSINKSAREYENIF